MGLTGLILAGDLKRNYYDKKLFTDAMLCFVCFCNERAGENR